VLEATNRICTETNALIKDEEVLDSIIEELDKLMVRAEDDETKAEIYRLLHRFIEAVQ
jgi:CRISPR/Cas system CSM-associated protein Csm2 small subunit